MVFTERASDFYRTEKINITSFILILARFVPLPKSVTSSRIQSNAQLYDFNLDDEDMSSLDALDQGKDGAISWNPVDAA